ncbi:hypothetical protein FACS1894111_10170 [Clostridia bacterium]|nr:hypothetical protein FACS1894111_10170 [Clostridia bacterium]
MNDNNNEELEERYALVMERITQIPGEQTVQTPFRSYFTKAAEFLLQLKNRRIQLLDGSFFSLSLAGLEEANSAIYEDIKPEQYEASYANPAYAVEVFGEDYGKLLSLLYAAFYKLPEALMAGRIEEVVIYCELFVEIYNLFEVGSDTPSVSEDLAPVLTEPTDNTHTPPVSSETTDNTHTPPVSAETIRKTIYQFYYDYTQFFSEKSIRLRLEPEGNFYTELLRSADLTDIRYLYRYGSHIGANEIGLARFLNTLSKEAVCAMAHTYTEGYRRGFSVTRKDISKKKTVELCYPIGFERVLYQAILNFEQMGLAPVVRASSTRAGAVSVSINEQFDYDHKADDAAYLDKAYGEHLLECLKNSFEARADLAAVYGGPAVIESFGKEPFAPISKSENYQYDKEQQKLSVYLMGKQGQMFNEYINKVEKYSFTIIAYPLPEIGADFEAIFEKTLALNNLDYELYQNMQQKIIDVLDQADYVHIKGSGKNTTDLRVSIYPLRDPEKETAFENCVADVNIPVGEVFTSPRLQGTNGVLHVTEVFLNQLKYIDLEIVFLDGMIQSYSCKNFATEQENREFLKENLLHHHDTLPIGEFAIGTNTLAYQMGREYGISGKLPILIAEKTGPHFAVGDTCYTWSEDIAVYNPDGKEIVARDNEISILRKTDPQKAYYNCHTDITIPYDELDSITVVRKDGTTIPVIAGGRFVVEGTEVLNEVL